MNYLVAFYLMLGCTITLGLVNASLLSKLWKSLELMGQQTTLLKMQQEEIEELRKRFLPGGWYAKDQEPRG